MKDELISELKKSEIEPNYDKLISDLKNIGIVPAQTIMTLIKDFDFEYTDAKN